MRLPSLPLFQERRRPEWALLGVVLAASACASNQRLAQQEDQVNQQLELARYEQAERCAPEDYAVAQSNLEFASLEYDLGHYLRAREHLDVAISAAQRAVKTAEPCMPDVDKDGLHDKVDQCPNEFGPKENHGCPWPDTDKDGLTDNIDKCPMVPGPKENNGCPWGDRDKDGIPDNIDKCPDVPEDKDGFQDDDGCPEPDNDQDGVADLVDRCPMEKGPASNQGCPVMDSDGDGILDNVDKCPLVPGIPELQGCPATDRDGDGVPDFIDKCPDEPGLITEQGCPKKYSLVVLHKDKIEIKQQVHFATNKFKILPDSFDMLNQVADVLKDNGKLRIHIDGHTDSVADDDFNMKLSQKRAEAVREFLMNAGVTAERLVAQGFGETRPIASNSTEEGRAMNRRVEFNIIDANAPQAPAPPPDTGKHKGKGKGKGGKKGGKKKKKS